MFLDDSSIKDFFREINTNTYTFYKLVKIKISLTRLNS